MVALGLNYEVGAVPLVLDEVYNWEDLFTLHGFISNSHFGFHFLLLCLAFTFFRKKKSRWLQSFNPKNQGSDVIGFKVRIAALFQNQCLNLCFWMFYKASLSDCFSNKPVRIFVPFQLLSLLARYDSNFLDLLLDGIVSEKHEMKDAMNKGRLEFKKGKRL